MIRHEPEGAGKVADLLARFSNPRESPGMNFDKELDARA